MIDMEYFKQAFELLEHPDDELLQIIFTTLKMSFFSTGISALIGLPLGVLIGKNRFFGKGAILRVTNTLMGMPPVVAGVIVFMLFRSIGPFGALHLMFSVPLMVIAQVVLITPVVTGLSAAAAGDKSAQILETARGIRISGIGQLGLLLRECAPQFVSITLMGFGRSIAEVGAVSLVGGNIRFKTRVMTTAILLETNRGDFNRALALGIVLMLISLIANIPAYSLQEKLK